MNNNLLVSVIMPTYNSEKYIIEAIESVLYQTFADFEFIILDDGSTDDTVKIVRSFKDPRIRLILCDHDYINTLNRGIESAKGEYIARMDSDDIMTPDRIKIQYKFMIDNPKISVSSSWAQTLGAKNGKILKVPLNHKEIENYMIYRNPLIHPTTMIKRLCFKVGVRYKYYSFAEDYKLWTDLIKMGFHFAGIPEVLLLYRQHENQITIKNYDQMIETTNLIKFEYIQYIIDHISENNDNYNCLFDTVIDSANEKNITAKTLSEIIGSIHRDYISRSHILI